MVSPRIQFTRGRDAGVRTRIAVTWPLRAYERRRADVSSRHPSRPRGVFRLLARISRSLGVGWRVNRRVTTGSRRDRRIRGPLPPCSDWRRLTLGLDVPPIWIETSRTFLLNRNRWPEQHAPYVDHRSYYSDYEDFNRAKLQVSLEARAAAETTADRTDGRTREPVRIG